MTIAERMQRTRKITGLTQEELADRIGVQRNTVWRWENGKAKPEAETVSKIASALNVSTGYLLGETDDPEPLQEQQVSATVKEPQIKTEDKGVLVYEANGQKIQVPATPEYAAQFWARVDNMIGKGGEQYG